MRAAPEALLAFLFWDAGPFGLPVIAIYTIAVYRVLGGKDADNRSSRAFGFQYHPFPGAVRRLSARPDTAALLVGCYRLEIA
jgi:hypothetical protein